MQRKMQFTSHWMRLLIVALVLGGQVGAQEAQTPPEPAPVRTTRVRLPAYFAAVVSPTQREQVYKLQMLYGKQIGDLQQQIAELEKKRDKEVDAVLTPEQLAEVQKRRDAAEARRRARTRPTEEEATSTEEATR